VFPQAIPRRPCCIVQGFTSKIVSDLEIASQHELIVAKSRPDEEEAAVASTLRFWSAQSAAGRQDERARCMSKDIQAVS
jgi:hypothetical protein